MFGYGFTIFLSAFLLFEVQLILAKRILPWFGGAPAVWTTCMLFFQFLLLGGYAYAHGLVARLTLSAQRRLHLGLLAVSVLLLLAMWSVWGNPILPDADWRPTDSGAPIAHILLLLTVSIGLPFFILSATNPLLTAWFSHSHAGAAPYRLYALSNFGSLLGLLGYPFLIEWLLPLQAQTWLWVSGYLLFVAGITVVTLTATRGHAVTTAPAHTAPGSARPARGQYALWFALSACASVLLLAATNQMTQEIAVIPLLWVLPLSLYLLSFILCFESDRWYVRGPYAVALLVALPLIGVVLQMGVDVPILVQIGAYTVVLFLCCMACHGELARLKPAARHLTAFYLTVTAGGAAGGSFVALLAPQIFSGYWELHLGLWSCAALLGLVWWRDRQSFLHRGSPWPVYLAPAAALGLIAYLHLDSLTEALTQAGTDPVWIGSAIGGSLVLVRMQPWLKRLLAGRAARILAGLAALLLFAGTLTWLAREPLADALSHTRNFYGVLHVTEDNADDEETHRYRLKHGRITHGYQYQRSDLRGEPTAYYGNDSGIGLILLRHPRRFALPNRMQPLRVGVVGLGVGTLAAYGNTGDYYRFYEINPDVIKLSKTSKGLFTYLRHSEADTETVLGDARLVLEQELARGQAQGFDVLAIDAFSSDAIPVHLLTQEAFEIYFGHLRDADSVLAVHISNRYLDLKPVLWALKRHFGLHWAVVESEDAKYLSESTWVLLARSEAPLQVRGLDDLPAVETPADIPLWRDDYSNLFRIIKW